MDVFFIIVSVLAFFAGIFCLTWYYSDKKEKKENQKLLIIGVILLVVCLISAIPYFSSGTSSSGGSSDDEFVAGMNEDEFNDFVDWQVEQDRKNDRKKYGY